MADHLYSELSVWADRREDQGAWLFGVTLDGADVTLFSRKLGGVDSDIESARLAAAQAPPATPPAADTPAQ